MEVGSGAGLKFPWFPQGLALRGNEVCFTENSDSPSPTHMHAHSNGLRGTGGNQGRSMPAQAAVPAEVVNLA